MEENLKILILEDVPFDAELINRELEKSGMKFISRRVEEEEDFLRELNVYKPDVILADHSLPHFDGISALEISKDKCPDVPFIFVSGKMGEDFAIEALKCGATDYVLKGSLSKIVHAVNRALEEVEEHSKRKIVESALRSSHRQLMEAQKIGHIGSWEWNIQTEEMSCSEEFYNILSLEPTEFGKSYQDLIDIIHPDDRRNVQEGINGALNEHKPFSNDYRLIRPDGTVRILSSKGEVIRDSNGKPLRIVGTEQDITEQKLAEEKIKSSLKEKEMLLQEIHHRVKNNLQVISSLLRLQSRYIKDQEAIDIFKETQNRVRSIAILHEKLYQSDDLAKIKFDEYVKILAEDLLYFYELDEGNIKMIIDIEDVSLNIETAIPCGLIIDEIVANSLKYAFPNEREGIIKIELHSDDYNQFNLMIRDNGVGMPQEFDPEKADTFGMQLIKYLTKQLKATIELDKNNGTKYNLKFNELKYKDRVKSNG